MLSRLTLAFLAIFGAIAAQLSAEPEVPEASASVAPVSLPFQPGERLVYSLKWGIFVVGEATLEVLNDTQAFGEPGYHIRFNVTTNSFADKFYKVRTKIETFPSKDMARSLHYRTDQREGDRMKSFAVMMDWESGQITRVENGEVLEPLSPEGPMHDPLSILFYFRTASLEENTLIPLPATDGKKLISVDAKVGRKDRIKVPAGKFSAYRVQPNMKDLGGVFRKSKNAALDIWFTDDEKRIPVRLKSKVRVGSFRADLKRIETFEPEPPNLEEETAILSQYRQEIANAKAETPL